jgi:hypothetical protein
MYEPKKLTGWLIFLIIILGFGSLGSGGAILRNTAQSYQSYFEDYPSLPNAIMLFQLLFGASICTGIYTAWTLYRRIPGTLSRAQNGLLLTAALRIASGGIIPIMGGLPPDPTRQLTQDWLIEAVVGFAATAAWYSYLSRSKLVQEIYATSE